MGEHYTIRAVDPEKDEAAVYEVCLKTGDSGKDGTHLYDDPKVLGHVFAGPYIYLQTEAAFVLEDSQGVCGYVLGAIDSESFYERMANEWFPKVRESYSRPTGDPAGWTPTEHIVNILFNSDEPKLFPGYPSHLHIDLIERAQGSGQGRKMMETVLDCLKENRSPGVHLGMSDKNDHAYGFYIHYGFSELERDGGTIYMGLKF
jgi:ribosomal protein S18 acetylase RimI-like enzyme